MDKMIALLIILTLIQYYICWSSYRNWFYNEITTFTMKESYSIVAMVCILPIFVWVPILPIIIIIYTFGFKYLTLKWTKQKD